MGGVVRSCIQSILKLVNSLIGMAGLAMILYAGWMIRYWQRKTGELPFGDSDYPPPWYQLFLSFVIYSWFVKRRNEEILYLDFWIIIVWSNDWSVGKRGNFEPDLDVVWNRKISKRLFDVINLYTLPFLSLRLLLGTLMGGFSLLMNKL